MTRLSRRSFLRGSGVCLSLPWLEWTAKVGEETPRRLVYLYVPNGLAPGGWMVGDTGEHGPQAPTVLKTLSPMLAPLQRHVGAIQVLSGLTQAKARANGDGAGDHARAAATFLTGVQALKADGAIGIGISADQVAARAVGQRTPVRSIQLGTEGGRLSGQCDSGYACAYSSFVSWETAQTPAGKETNPTLVFDRLFRGGLAPCEVANQATLRKQRRSILDFVRADASDLRKSLGASDLARLDEYESGLRELERRLQHFEQLRVDEVPDEARPSGSFNSLEQHFKLLADVLVLALATDQTRIATLMIGNEGSNRAYPELGSTEGHHALSHHRGEASKVAVIRAINQHHLELFAYFLDRLRDVPVGESSLLDASMLLYGSGIGDGNTHSHHDLPVLLAGGGGGTLTPGRHLTWATDTPLNNLHLALLERMGVEINGLQLGDASGVLRGI